MFRKSIPWKKNSVIDNLAVMLEQPFDAARTKEGEQKISSSMIENDSKTNDKIRLFWCH